MERRNELNAQKLTFNLLQAKVKNNLSEYVDENSYKDYVKSLLEEINQYNYPGGKYFIKEESFSTICEGIIKDKEMNQGGKSLIYNDYKLWATYDLIESFGSYIDSRDIHSYLTPYINKLKKEKSYFINNFDLSKISNDQAVFSKQAAAYIVLDIINKYIRDKIKKQQWPICCSDINEFIFKKDLSSVIGLEGTRELFLNLYNHATCVIASYLSKNKNFIISNNDSYCLAYAHFLDIVGPFPLVLNYKSDCFSCKDITVKVENGIYHLFKTFHIGADTYGRWDNRDDIINPEPSDIKYEVLDEAVETHKIKILSKQ